MQREMAPFLLNMKLLYQHAVAHSQNKSKMDLLLAIHNSHYVVEQILRERAKDMPFQNALHKIGFEEIIKRVNQVQPIQYYNRLLELDRIRNNAEHLNLIPSAQDVQFYVKIVEDFLTWSFQIFFQVDYNKLRFEDSIVDTEVRDRMLKANEYINAKNYKSASEWLSSALAVFKSKLFAFFADPRLKNASIDGVSITEVLSDLALKIFFSNDVRTLSRMTNSRAQFIEKDGKTLVVWNTVFTEYQTDDEARKDYENVLNIILTYQNRFTF